MKQLVELPIEPDEVGRYPLNVGPGEEGSSYEHASWELKDGFDAIGLAMGGLSGQRRKSMNLLTAKTELRLAGGIWL